MIRNFFTLAYRNLSRNKVFSTINIAGLAIGMASAILLSFFIAAPIAWWAMHNWLQSYSYRTPESWWIFAVVLLLSLLITFLTIGFQSIKTAMMNPAKSLRSE